MKERRLPDGVVYASHRRHPLWLWSQNISVTTWLIDTVTTPMLLKMVQSRKIDPALLITHRFKLNETFGRAAKTQALKVIIDI